MIKISQALVIWNLSVTYIKQQHTEYSEYSVFFLGVQVRLTVITTSSNYTVIDGHSAGMTVIA